MVSNLASHCHSLLASIVDYTGYALLWSNAFFTGRHLLKLSFYGKFYHTRRSALSASPPQQQKKKIKKVLPYMTDNKEDETQRWSRVKIWFNHYDWQRNQQPTNQSRWSLKWLWIIIFTFLSTRCRRRSRITFYGPPCSAINLSAKWHLLNRWRARRLHVYSSSRWSWAKDLLLRIT